MKKADGTAFEKEFRAKFEKDYYVKRLPTLRTYAGLSQPADFVLVGDNFNYVELKETAGDRFSVSTMQQYEEVKDFLAYKKRLGYRSKCIKNYWLIIRFMGQGVSAIVNDQILEYGENKRTLRYGDEKAVNVSLIENLIREELF